jgi:hypothetical protein
VSLCFAGNKRKEGKEWDNDVLENDIDDEDFK